MKEIEKDIRNIKENMVEVKHDLRYHIKRTDLLEAFMKNQIKFLLAVITAIVLGVVGKAYAKTAPIDEALSSIQAAVPCTIVVTSGKRSKDHNKKVGGAKHSYHLTDRARDIVAPCMSTEDLGYIASLFANGVIVYNKHVHIDNRNKKLYWDRRTK